MTPPPRTQQWLRDFLHTADEAQHLIVDAGYHRFRTDRTHQLAAEALLHRLGEIVARLPDEFLDEHPTISWRAIRGMRNIIAHEYQAIDYHILWNALTTRLPVDAAAIRTMLSADQPITTTQPHESPTEQ